MLDAVAAAAIEMAGAAIGSLRPPDALRDLGQSMGFSPSNMMLQAALPFVGGIL